MILPGVRTAGLMGGGACHGRGTAPRGRDSKAITIWALSFTRLEANRNLLTAMSLLPKSIHRCRCYPTKFNSGRTSPFDTNALSEIVKRPGREGRHFVEYAGTSSPP